MLCIKPGDSEINPMFMICIRSGVRDPVPPAFCVPLRYASHFFTSSDTFRSKSSLFWPDLEAYTEIWTWLQLKLSACHDLSDSLQILSFTKLKIWELFRIHSALELHITTWEHSRVTNKNTMWYSTLRDFGDSLVHFRWGD